MAALCFKDQKFGQNAIVSAELRQEFHVPVTGDYISVLTE
jgi:hypothetical protein